MLIESPILYDVNPSQAARLEWGGLTLYSASGVALGAVTRAEREGSALWLVIGDDFEVRASALQLLDRAPDTGMAGPCLMEPF